MLPEKRRPRPGGDCGASEKVLACGFDFLRDKPLQPQNQVPSTPPDFDPAACPILATHWFGLAPSASDQRRAA